MINRNVPSWLRQWTRSPRQDRRVVVDGEFVELTKPIIPKPEEPIDAVTEHYKGSLMIADIAKAMEESDEQTRSAETNELATDPAGPTGTGAAPSGPDAPGDSKDDSGIAGRAPGSDAVGPGEIEEDHELVTALSEASSAVLSEIGHYTDGEDVLVGTVGRDQEVERPDSAIDEQGHQDIGLDDIPF